MSILNFIHINSQIIKDMSSSRTQQMNLLQNYNKKLEDENLAQTTQIKTLRQQLDKQTATSATTARVISTSTYNVSNCLNCKGKDTEIANLNQTIKDLKQNQQRQIQRINTQNAQNAQRIQSQTIIKQVPSASQTAQLEALKKAYEELRVKFQQNQRSEWSRLRVYSSAQNANNTNNNNEQIRQQSQLIRQQNQALLGKIDYLQKRVGTLEEANRLLREEIIAHVSVRGSGQGYVSQPVERTYVSSQPMERVGSVPGQQTQAQQSQPQPQQQSQPQTQTIPTTNIGTVSYTVSQQPPPVPIFNYISPQAHTLPIPVALAPPQAKTVSFQLPPHPTYITQVAEPGSYQAQPPQLNYQQYLPPLSPGNQSCGCTYLSPLAVLGHRHGYPTSSGINNYTNINHSHNHSGYDSSYDSDYYKDIVQERWRSLQYKIKVLQQENNVLRNEVGGSSAGGAYY